ncbi:MAG: hypothetical protein WCK88_05740 [bacterium]
MLLVLLATKVQNVAVIIKNPMLLSGIKKSTLLDYPGKVATIVFTMGCNFRCGYCHNSEFVLPEKMQKICHDCISEEVFFRFLKTRI